MAQKVKRLIHMYDIMSNTHPEYNGMYGRLEGQDVFKEPYQKRFIQNGNSQQLFGHFERMYPDGPTLLTAEHVHSNDADVSFTYKSNFVQECTPCPSHTACNM